MGRAAEGVGAEFPLASVLAMRIDRDGTATVTFLDGTTASDTLGSDAFTATSSIASSCYFPLICTMLLTTTRGHHVRVSCTH